jgi:hypothetical protein
MASGQEPAKPDADAQSGMRTGGFVDVAPVYFLDVTHQAGLESGGRSGMSITSG